MNDLKEKVSLSSIHGRVTGRWVSSQREIPLIDTHNMMSYAAADVLAAAYGGDTSRIPKYVGFLYSNDADLVLDELSRDMTMSTIDELAKKIHGNVQVVGFSRPPTVFGESVVYREDLEDDGSNDVSNESGGGGRNNIVEFHAVTRTGHGAKYIYPTTGDGLYCGALAKGNAIHRAILLGDSKEYSTRRKEYTVLAMVDLKKNGKYREKPENYELALDWRVTFE